MKAGGGKTKGSQFEREVCVLLSKWVSRGLQEDVFWRSAMSGGRSTVAFKKGKSLSSQVGDISCVHPIGNTFISKFAPECKFYRDLEYQGLLKGKGKLLAFWDEIHKQAGRYEKLPMLFARQNRLPTTVCLTYEGLGTLGLREDQTVLISHPHNIYIVLADRFVDECKPFT